jgi:uncharacterized protein YbjQ (UPF0145 family)
MTVKHPKIDFKKSLQQVSSGGIPLRAEQRLQEEAGDDRRLFTSDLSVREFVLTRHAHCEPIAQVMGSSIYHVGTVPDYKGATSEITIISDGHRSSRRLALDRLKEEAALVGCDAVVGVHLRDRMITMGNRGKGGDDGGEVLEFTVVGTAVKAPWITHRKGEPIITDLSGQDLWALAQDGYEPCGFLFEFCRYHVWHVTKDFRSSVGELDQASQAVEQARKIAAGRLLQQAADHQAEYVIGSDVSVRVKEVPCGFERCTLDDLDVDVSWFGTGVRRIPDAKPVQHGIPPLILSMMPLGRRKDEVIEGEDDSKDVEIAAEEAEEAALEAE